jgi:hypothetical protein
MPHFSGRHMMYRRKTTVCFGSHSYHSMQMHTRIIYTSTFHTTDPQFDLSLGTRWNYRCASQLTLWKFRTLHLVVLPSIDRIVYLNLEYNKTLLTMLIMLSLPITSCYNTQCSVPDNRMKNIYNRRIRGELSYFAPLLLLWRYSPGWALASIPICLQTSRSLALPLHSFIP